jgi:hypothetical protein
LITKLLTKDKGQRLGRVNDVKDVMAHPWFASINVEKLLRKEIVPPFKPELKAQDDTSHFDEKFQQLEVAESIIDP